MEQMKRTTSCSAGSHLQTTLRVLLVSGVFFSAACGGPGTKASKGNAAPAGSVIPISTAPVVSRQVPLTIQATGSFIAEESSEVAPQTSGWIASTPVDVGAFVKQGDVILRLDDRDARLRLQQAQAAQSQAEAAVRQAQSKIGLSPKEAFDATVVPEVQAARAAYESAEAEAKLAAADAKRYANLVDTGDVSLSNYEKQRTQAETAQARANAARRQYETALNVARQNYQGIERTRLLWKAQKPRLRWRRKR